MPLLLGLEQVKGSTLRNVEHSLELELTLNREVLDGKVVLPVVGDGLVEASVLLLRDVLRVPTITVRLWTA